MGKNVHVTHRRDRSWAVISEGSQRASSLHKTQGEAIEAGQGIAENNKSELVIDLFECHCRLSFLAVVTRADLPQVIEVIYPSGMLIRE